MFNALKGLLARYDAWCKSLGLTPEQKRCCVPIKVEDIVEQNQESDRAAETTGK